MIRPRQLPPELQYRQPARPSHAGPASGPSLYEDLFCKSDPQHGQPVMAGVPEAICCAGPFLVGMGVQAADDTPPYEL